MSAYTPDQARRASWTANPVTRSVTSSSAASTALAPGLYEITTDTDCFFKQGASDVTATTSSNPLWSKSSKLIYVTDTATNGYIAVIRASADGTLYICNPKGE